MTKTNFELNFERRMCVLIEAFIQETVPLINKLLVDIHTAGEENGEEFTEYLKTHTTFLKLLDHLNCGSLEFLANYVDYLNSQLEELNASTEKE